MGRRWVAGVGQILLAVIGFGFILAWFILLMAQTYQQINEQAPTRSIGWLAEIGLAIFLASWLWSLVTSLSLLKEARANETVGET